MSATTDATGTRTITELRRMDESEAKDRLTYREFQRWESVNRHLDEAAEVREEWRENDAAATDILVNTDVSGVASEVELFGNPCTVYFDPEDRRVREVIDRLGEAAGVDIADLEDTTLTAEDIDDEAIDDVKDAMADFIGVALYSWHGHAWADLPVADREAVKLKIKQPRPDGWGLLGLMDALNDIIVAVESDRDARLERVEKFRRPERRGDR